jgi:GNAT superfamily N-acetyltransferase
MRLRKADLADADIVTELRVAFMAELRSVNSAEFAPSFVAQTRSFVEVATQRGVLRSWLAENERPPAVGIVSLLMHDMPPRLEDTRTREGHVLNMYVRPGHRRHGLGRALLDACVRDARSAGVRRLYLHATDDARKVCDRSGFTPNDRWLELLL